LKASTIESTTRGEVIPPHLAAGGGLGKQGGGDRSSRTLYEIKFASGLSGGGKKRYRTPRMSTRLKKYKVKMDMAPVSVGGLQLKGTADGGRTLTNRPDLEG